jgi:2,4-dienoyl-CoA reductase-like NADH-dependent reductase (Old Yellow Enzyme family)
MALGDGQLGISPRFHAYLLARANGGAAMIGTESAPVHPSTMSRSLGIRLYEDAVIPSLRHTAEAVRAADSRLAITLWHGGHKDSFIRGSYALAPSPVPNMAGQVPKQITATEISGLVTAYGEAAERCLQAGLDAIELQTSTDYLLGSFLSPVLNRRTDAYGGNFNNRIRFVVQILESIRERVGDKLAVGVRTSARHDIPGSPLDYGLEESVASMTALNEAGLVDYVSVMIGSAWSPPESSSIPHMAQPRIQLADEGKAFKQALSVPVILAGRIRSPEDAERTIAEGSADIVAMARTWIADPDWGNKVTSGRTDEIRPCMSCNQACVGFVFSGIPGSCVLNPVAGREAELGEVGTSEDPRTVSIIGGGPAGMEAARVCALRGHTVTLFEAGPELGGEFRLAAQAPHRAEMQAALDWWQRELLRLNVNIVLNTTVGLDTTLDSAVTIWAIGAQPSPMAVWRLRPYLFEGIPGTADLPSGRQILNRQVEAIGNVLVIDEEGGWAAVSLAETLAANDKVSAVTVTTPERALGDRALSLTWELATVRGRLRAAEILVLTETQVHQVLAPTAELTTGETIGPFDSIILSTGTSALPTPPNALAIGDCVAPRGLWAATSDATKLARTL